MLMFLLIFANTTYATDVIKLVVPYPPGGPTDVIARFVIGKLKDQIPDTTIYVEYRPGASSSIGTAYVANEDPSNIVLLLNSPAAIINYKLDPAPKYNINNLIPLSYIGQTPMILVSSRKFSVKSLEEWKALNSNTPVMLSTSGVNSSSSITSIQFKKIINKNIINVPYKGMEPALVDIVGNNVDGGFTFLSPQVISFINNGSVIPVAVEWNSRLPSIPNVPTFKESGIASLGYNNWQVLFVNKTNNTTKLNQIKQAMVRILSDSKNVKQLSTICVEVLPNQLVPPANFLNQEMEKITNTLTLN